MKLLALPALFLAMAAPAYAGITTALTATSGKHWSAALDRDFSFDDAVLKPFDVTVRSSLLPLFFGCSNSYRATVHTSYCSFEEQSDWQSPYELEYLDRLEHQYPMFRDLTVLLRVNNDGSYRGYFGFMRVMEDFKQDAIGHLHDVVTTRYQFNFEGSGMAWDTTMDTAVAQQLWQPQSMRGSYWSDWTRYQANSLTGEETELESDGWTGTLKAAAVPEPAALGLFGIGLAAIAGLRRRKRSQVTCA